MDTSNDNTAQQFQQQLLQHLLTAKDAKTLAQLLSNLLTPSEMTEISKRLQIFKLLEAGLPQRQIAEQLGVGIATVTRGSRALKQNSSE
jgi:TrpR family trp operon transcriptional repressor